MSQWMQRMMQGSVRASACLVLIVGMTGCSVFESSHVVEPDPAVSLQAVASADRAFVAEPFSLVAADSVGLMTFGYEIAQWAEKPPESLAQQY